MNIVNERPLCLFALQATATFGAAVASALGQGLAAHEERECEDQEHKARPLDNVFGRGEVRNRVGWLLLEQHDATMDQWRWRVTAYC
jgi:hypothetical protein